ncbi:hypothetical protein KI387_019191, partial [Taxus chinensis]
MSRQQRKQIRVEKLAEIVDFKFLQFHATKVPNGWDKLAVSVISVETGKAIARTNKAVVDSGNCKWLEDVSESVRFLQDDNSRELEEKLYKFVVSMGSARLGILGEATVNLADYLNSKELVWIKLPLKKCNYGTILHVKIQCLTPRSGPRESERWSKSVKEQVERIAVFNEKDDGSEGSIRSTRSSFHGRSNNAFLQTEDADYLPGNSRHGLDSLELSAADSAINGNSKAFAYGDQASPSSIKNGFHRRQHSTGPQDGITEYRTGNGIDQYGARLFGGKDSGTVEYPRNRSFDRATSGNGSSNEFLEAAEVSIQELRKESMIWERKAQNFSLETETLKQQLAEQQRQHREMEMQFLTMQTERDSFKQEVQQLESVLQNYIENEKGAENAKFEAQDAKRMVKEFEDEIKLQKESNANLSLQLSKIQEANTELVFALQDLEETVEQQNVEIEKLLEVRERNRMNISEKEAEEMRQSAESVIKFSDVVAETDNLKKEVEKLRSDVEHGIYNVETKESDVKHDVQELQKDIKNKELSTKLSLNVQNVQVLNQEFSPIADEIDDMLIDKDNETHENLSTANKMFEACAPGQRQFKKNMYNIEAERMQKLSYQKEEIKTLKKKISSISSVHSLTENTEYIDQSQQDLHQDLEILKRDMNELEKDCKELTDENLELIHSLNKVNKNLEYKNVYIAELEEKLRVSSFGSTSPGERYIGIQTGNATSQIDELKAHVNDLEKKTDSSKPLYSTELISMEMLLHDSQSQVMKAQNDNSSLQNKLNTFEERIQELESELKNAYEQTAKTEKMLTASNGQQLDAHDSRAYKSEQELAGAIQKVQALKIKNINDTIFIEELKFLVTQLNQKVETSEHLHRTELANMKRSLNENQNQVLELESRKLEMECLLNIFKKRVCDLEREVITAQQETIEREIDLTVNFESQLQDNEARADQAEKEVANALQLVQTLEEDKSTHAIQSKGLNDHLTDLEQKLNWTTDSYMAEFANKEKLLTDFQHQVINLQNQNHVLEGELSVLKGRIHDLESEVQSAEQEIVKREEDVTAAYEYKLQNTEARAIRIEVDLAHSHERVKSCESSTAKDAVIIEDLKLKIVQLQQEIKSFEDVHNMELADQEKSFSNFQNQEMKLQSENIVLENKIRALNEKICELDNEAQKSQQETADREKEIAHKEKLLSDFQRQVMNIQNQNHGLQGELNNLKERNCGLESAVQTAEREIVKREKEVTAAYEYKLQITDARAIRAEAELADILERVNNFESSSAKEAIIKDGLKVEVAQLQKELKSSEDVHSMQLAGLEKSVSDFQNQLMKLQSANTTLECKVSIMNEKKIEMENETQREAIEREDEIANKEKLLSDFQHQVIDLYNQNHGLQGELTVLKERIGDLESEAQTAERERVKREEEVTTTYEYNLQRTEGRAIRAEVDLADSLKRIKSFEFSTAKDAIMIDGLRVQIIQLQQELKSSEDAHSMQLAGMEKSLQEFQNQVKNLKNENTSLEKTICTLKEKIFKLKNEAQKAQQEAVDKEKDLSAAYESRLQANEARAKAAEEEVDSCRIEQKLLELTLENLKKEHTAAMDLNSELEEKCFNLFESRTNVEQRLQKITENIFVYFNQIKSLESDLSILQQNVTGKKGISAPNTEAYQLATREYEEKGIKSDEAISQKYSENENAVESLQMKVQSLSRQVYSVLEEKERILNEALIEASDLRAARMNLENSLQLNQANTKQSEADFLRVKQEYESEVQELKLEVEAGRKREEDLHLDLGDVHRQLENTNVREADLQRRVQEIKIQVAAIENEKQKLKAENISLSRQVDQLMGLKAETDALPSIVEHARDEKHELQQSLHSTEAELGSLKAENVFLMEKLAATNQGLVKVDELTQRNAELEEKILCLQAELNAKEVEHKNKSVQLQRLSDQFQWKLQNLEELKENYLTKENLLENEQFNVFAISKAEALYPDRSDCKLGCTSPPQDTNQSTKLSDEIRTLEIELETRIKEFEEKEETLITEIQKLEEMNHQLMQAKLDSDTDQLQIELIRLQKQNSTLLQKQYELSSKLGAHELLQKEVSRLHEVNKQLETQLARFRETAKGGNILERVVAMETELAEALEVNSMYQLQLQSFLHQEQNVHLAALHGFGPIDHIISDLVSYKRKISTLEAELNDLRERYSSLSLKLAEVEVQREELVMTIKHAKYGKR